MEERRRLVVLVSGSGTNLSAILGACAAGALCAEVVAVVCNKSDSYALIRAADAEVESVCMVPKPDETRSEYDIRLADVVAGFKPDLIVLAGWMRILSLHFLSRFPGQVINLHPALPGDLPGVHAIQRAWRESRNGQRTRTGAMVHLVIDEGVDNGPVIASEAVPIFPEDTSELLGERVRIVEHRLLIKSIGTLLEQNERHATAL